MLFRHISTTNGAGKFESVWLEMEKHGPLNVFKIAW